jgi:hypothetical protein
MSDNDNEVAVTTSTDDLQDIELELDDIEVEDDVDALKSQIAEKTNFAKQAVARAKKAEAELKALKSKSADDTQPNIKPAHSTQETIEETILKAQGESQEMIDAMKKVAQVTGKTLIEARQDAYIVSLRKAKEDEVKSNQARLPASRGSGSVKKEKSFSTPGLSEAEFKELWRAKNGR